MPTLSKTLLAAGTAAAAVATVVVVSFLQKKKFWQTTTRRSSSRGRLKSHQKRSLVRLSFDDNNNHDGLVQEIVSLLRRDGAVVVENVLTPDAYQTLQRDILALADTEYTGVNDTSFAGQYTRRCGPYILQSSAMARQLAAHTLHVAVSQAMLQNNQCNNHSSLCQKIRLSVVAGIRVMPGQETPQELHRDDDEWPLALLTNNNNNAQLKDGLEVEISAMWALTDFTTTNGATNVVVGSHGRHDPNDPVPSRDQCQQAVMPAGSVLFFTGSVWHGTGAAKASTGSNNNNNTSLGRMGFLVQHIVGWLHPEYNLHFAVDLKYAASHFEPALKSLLGFDGPDLFPQARLPGPVYATAYTGFPQRKDADFANGPPAEISS